MSAHAHPSGSSRSRADASLVEALARLGDALSKLADYDARLRTLVASARELVHASGCALVTTESNTPQPVAWDGMSGVQAQALATQVDGISRINVSTSLGQSSARARPASEHAWFELGVDGVMGEVVHCRSNATAVLFFVWRRRAAVPCAYRDAARVLASYAGWTLEGIASERARDAALTAHTRYRDDFVCVASHELRSPLTALQLQLQLVARRIGRLLPNDATLSRVADGIDKAVQKCGQLVALGDTLLDATRIESGIFHVRRAPCDVSDALHETIESLCERLSHAGCDVHLAIEPNVHAFCDRTRVQQVASNLLGNVIKYAAGSRVAVSLRQTAEGTVFEVQDSGPGIPERRQQQIFERFERTGTSEATEGWGLGLYIVRQIVDAHAGAIRVRHATPTGTIFTVTLPRVVKENER